MKFVPRTIAISSTSCNMHEFLSDIVHILLANDSDTFAEV